MAASRIVAALILFSATVVAQPPAQILFSIKVTDQAGGTVPAAMIQIISSSSQTKFEIKTNSRGEAVLSLDPGAYTVWVRSSGFKTWRSTFDLQRDSSRSITAVLWIASNGSPIVIPVYLGPEIERQSLLATIPLESLESITVLTARATQETGPYASPGSLAQLCSRLRLYKSRESAEPAEGNWIATFRSDCGYSDTTRSRGRARWRFRIPKSDIKSEEQI